MKQYMDQYNHLKGSANMMRETILVISRYMVRYEPDI